MAGREQDEDLGLLFEADRLGADSLPQHRDQQDRDCTMDQDLALSGVLARE